MSNIAQVNKVVKKSMISRWEVVKYQLLTYCFFNNIQISNADLECLVLLITSEDAYDISSVSQKACDLNIFKSPQSVRNCLNKLLKKKLLVKTNKKIKINPIIGIVSEGNILLNYNFLALETSKS